MTGFTLAPIVIREIVRLIESGQPEVARETALEFIRALERPEDDGSYSPVFLFGHDYATHHGHCEIVLDGTSDRCTCGLKEAFEAALVSERAG